MGVRLPLFDYTGALLITYEGIQPYVRAQIKKIKEMKTGGKGWVLDRRGDILFGGGNITKLKGLGAATEKKLNELYVLTLLDLHEKLNNSDHSSFLAPYSDQKISGNKLSEWSDLLKDIVPGDPGKDVLSDHRKESNP